MKKLLISFIITFTLNLSTFALDENNNKTKILLEEAMNLAIIGNIELQEQRKNLDISQNKIAISNGLKNPQFQSNLLVGRIAKANSSQIGMMLPIEIAKRSARKNTAKLELQYTKEKILIKVLRQNDTYSIVESYSDEELESLGYSAEEISGMKNIKLYDEVVLH